MRQKPHSFSAFRLLLRGWKFYAVVILFISLVFSAVVLGNTVVKYRVDATKCVGCRLCVEVCPTDAITIVGGKAIIDPEKCIGCGECAKVCPTGAINSYETEAKDTQKKPSAATTGDSAVVETIKDSISLQKRNTLKKEIETPSAPEDTGGARAITHKETTEVIPTTKKVPRKVVAVVDPQKCIGCQLCVRACPENAITMVNGKAVIDPEKCTNCGECIKVCPVKAISSQEYEKDSNSHSK